MHKEKLPRVSISDGLESCQLCSGNPHCTDLNRHLRFVHSPTAPLPPYYHCSKCLETFFTESVLKDHICFGLIAEKDPYKRFFCPYCGGEGYEKKNNMVQHMKERHSPNPPSYKCEKEGCNFSTYRKWNLNLHLCNPDRDFYVLPKKFRQQSTQDWPVQCFLTNTWRNWKYMISYS